MSEKTFEQRIRDQHAADPKSMMFTGYAIIALDELAAHLAAEKQLRHDAMEAHAKLEADWRAAERKNERLQYAAAEDLKARKHLIGLTEAAEARAAGLEEAIKALRETTAKARDYYIDQIKYFPDEEKVGCPPSVRGRILRDVVEEIDALLAPAAEEGAGDVSN